MILGVRRGFVRSAAAVVVALCACTAGAKPPATETDDVARARLLGVLVYTNVTLSFEEVPAREAIAAMRKAVGVPIIGRWLDDSVGHGMDPLAPITLDVKDTDALSALEQVLEQAGLEEPCTWQLRKGFIEVGTKKRLAVPAARETRFYEIQDFMIEPPQAGDGDTKLKLEKNPGSVIGVPVNAGQRKHPVDIALEIVEMIVETIEPGRWDVDDPKKATDDDSAESDPSGVSEEEYPGLDAQPEPDPVAEAEREIEERERLYWGTIRVWRGQLLVRAPDFMHREINGYPKPIPPRHIADSDSH